MRLIGCDLRIRRFSSGQVADERRLEIDLQLLHGIIISHPLSCATVSAAAGCNETFMRASYRSAGGRQQPKTPSDRRRADGPGVRRCSEPWRHFLYHKSI